MTYNCSCGYSTFSPGSNYGQQYSSLESAIADYQPSINMSEEFTKPVIDLTPITKQTYSNDKYSEGLYLQNKTRQDYSFIPDTFLRDIPTEFISSEDNEEIKCFAEQAFKAVTGEELKGIKINVLKENDFKQAHESFGGRWNPGIRGFSVNKRGFGTSEVFVIEDELARLMLTLGHEIGHVNSLPMKESIDEEAKAFAFSMAWMKAVKENNIANLSSVINPKPAKNGLHNTAFEFVISLMEKGRKAIDVYLDLISGEVSINNAISYY